MGAPHGRRAPPLQGRGIRRARALAEQVVASSVPAPPVRARSLHLLAELHLMDSAPTAAPLLEEALTCSGDDPGYAAQIETSLCWVALTVVDFARADLHLGRAVELAERAGTLRHSPRPRPCGRWRG